MYKNALESFLMLQLAELKEKGLYNVIDSLEGANGPEVEINGKELIN